MNPGNNSKMAAAARAAGKRRLILEARVRERTADLAEAGAGLRKEIAERKQAEEATRQLAAIVESSNDAIIGSTLEGIITSWNRAAEKIYGYPAKEVVGRSKSLFTPPDGLNDLPSILRRIKRGEGVDHHEAVCVKKDGTHFQASLTVSPVRDRQGNLIGISAITRDITQRKLAEQSLRERTEELARANEILRGEIQARKQTEDALRKLTVRHLQSTDEERRRIARELHDITGQNLVALAMNLNIIIKSAKALAPPAQEAITESLLLLDLCSREIRTLSYLLHPPLLDELGLAHALRWFAEGFTQRSGIRVEVDVSPHLERLDEDVEIALFRIVQESLTNVHRHSGSPSARIRLSADQKNACLEVEDDGKGLPTQVVEGSASRLGVGVTGMRERVKQLGGQMELDSDTRGTRIRVVLPLGRGSR